MIGQGLKDGVYFFGAVAPVALKLICERNLLFTRESRRSEREGERMRLRAAASNRNTARKTKAKWNVLRKQCATKANALLKVLKSSSVGLSPISHSLQRSRSRPHPRLLFLVLFLFPSFPFAEPPAWRGPLPLASSSSRPIH